MAILSQIVKFKNNLLARVNAERLMLVFSLAASADCKFSAPFYIFLRG